MTQRSLCLAATALCLCGLVPSRGLAEVPVGAYLEPWMGGVKADYKSIEIERSFVTSTESGGDEGADIGVDPDAVGMRTRYTGSSPVFGISTGLRLGGLKLGLHAAWSSPRFDGYWKSYRYSEELGRASGQRVYGGGEVGLDRVMFEVGYGVPVWRLEIGFITRIGGVAFRPGDLEVGRSLDDTGLCAEMGARLDFSVVRYVSVGFGATVGGFFFDGVYDGAFGVYRTFSGIVSFRL